MMVEDWVQTILTEFENFQAPHYIQKAVISRLAYLFKVKG